VTAVQGLELGFLVGADHVVVRAQWLAFPSAGIQVEHASGLGAEVGVAGKDPGPVLPGLDRIGGQPSAYGGRRDRIGYLAADRLGGQLSA